MESHKWDLRIFGVTQSKDLGKFRGIGRDNFALHLKETEFRYNTKINDENLYQNLLKLIRNNPLKA